MVPVQRFMLLLLFVGKIISEPIITTFCQDVSLKEGGSTALKCTFPEDVVNLRKGFKVELYSNALDRTFPILLCHWSQKGELDCYEHDGYKYGGHVGNIATLNILHASVEDAGKYACVALSYSKPGTYKNCSLTVQALRTSTSYSVPQTTIIQAPNNGSDGEIQDPETFGSVKWSIILGALMTVIIILLIVIIVLFIKSRRKEKEQAKKTEALLENNKTNNSESTS